MNTLLLLLCEGDLDPLHIGTFRESSWGCSGNLLEMFRYSHEFKSRNVPPGVFLGMFRKPPGDVPVQPCEGDLDPLHTSQSTGKGMILLTTLEVVELGLAFGGFLLLIGVVFGIAVVVRGEGVEAYDLFGSGEGRLLEACDAGNNVRKIGVHLFLDAAWNRISVE